MEKSRTLVHQKLSMSKGVNYTVGWFGEIWASEKLLEGVKTRSFTSGEIMNINIYINDPISL